MDLKSATRIVEDVQAGVAVSTDLLADAVDCLVDETRRTYSARAGTYARARRTTSSPDEAYFDDQMLHLVRARIREGLLRGEPGGCWRLLDVGAGHGRDVARLSAEPDVTPVALDNCEAFADMLGGLRDARVLGERDVIVADMRDLRPLRDGTFHCVRNHATLHHLPVLHGRLGADGAVAEARRVLAPGGVFHVLVKAGTGVALIDTGENLGSRFYQLFTPELLAELLGRHDFATVHSERHVEMRGRQRVDWLFALAVAGRP